MTVNEAPLYTRPVRERDVEGYLVKRVEALGGEVRKLKWIGRRGAPDRLVMLPGRSFFVETKKPGEDAEKHQHKEHKVMRAAGLRVVIIDSIDSVDEVLNECRD